MILPVVILGVAAWSRRWVGDDGFINFRVVDQIFAGHGPVYNAGERVEITTSPLWLAILAGARVVTWWLPIEWVAVLLGIACTAFGVFAAQRGALQLDWASEKANALRIPVGILVLVALPPFWDYSSSALETGLAFAWLGGSWWLLVSKATRDDDDGRRWLVAGTCGLGPLIRPDLAVFSAAFLAVLLAWPGQRPLRGRLVVVTSAAFLPLIWQLFRMGFYGALLPNTAFAKEASLARWGQGWKYLRDTIGTYGLVLPLAALLVLALVPRVAELARADDRRRMALCMAPLVAGAVHWLWVMRVGGDFMHGRFVLPGLFAMALPVAALHVSRRAMWALAVVVVWGAVVMTSIRVDYPGIVGPDGIADERLAYSRFAQERHPVTADDYSDYVWVQLARDALKLAQKKRSVLVLGVPGFFDENHQVPLAKKEGRPVVAFPSAGMFSFVVGPDIHVIDELGLGDLIAGRQRLTERQRPGHEKRLDLAWAIARFADPGAPLPEPGPSPHAVASARLALRCDPVRELLAATTGPMTAGRFLDNLGTAIGTFRTRIPRSPVAAAELCRPGGQ